MNHSGRAAFASAIVRQRHRMIIPNPRVILTPPDAGLDHCMLIEITQFRVIAVFPGTGNSETSRKCSRNSCAAARAARLLHRDAQIKRRKRRLRRGDLPLRRVLRLHQKKRRLPIFAPFKPVPAQQVIDFHILRADRLRPFQKRRTPCKLRCRPRTDAAPSAAAP